MATFNYRVITPAGKEKKGTLEAKSRDAAMNMLKNDKNVVVQCDEATGLNKPLILLNKAKKVTPRDLALFCHQFASINKAGVSVVEAFGMLADQTENSALKDAINAVHLDISKGETLAKSMRKQSGVFPEMLTNMGKPAPDGGRS